MKKPEKVKIGAHVYKVKWPFQFEGADLAGRHQYHSGVICIADTVNNKPASASTQWLTFIHELIHAVEAISGHNVFDDNEGAIDGFSEVILAMLVDNGWLEIE